MLQFIIPTIVSKIIDAMIRDPHVPVNGSNAGEIKPAVRDAVTEVVRREVEPVVRHATNNEPWYQSRVTWGAIIAGVAAVVGWNLSVEEVGYYTDLAVSVGGPIAGVLLTLYGRYVARKPIGE